MNGEILDKKRGQFHFGMAPRPAHYRQARKEGYEERWLSRLFFQIVGILLVGLTFMKQFTFSSTYLDMNFWTSFPFITDKVTHF
jgi:hypothetical protein